MKRTTYLRAAKPQHMRYTTILSMLLALAALASCGDKTLSPEEQFVEDIRIIKQYLSDNNLTADSTTKGLHYIITNTGGGGNPNQQSSVKVLEDNATRLIAALKGA